MPHINISVKKIFLFFCSLHLKKKPLLSMHIVFNRSVYRFYLPPTVNLSPNNRTLKLLNKQTGLQFSLFDVVSIAIQSGVCQYLLGSEGFLLSFSSRPEDFHFEQCSAGWRGK